MQRDRHTHTYIYTHTDTHTDKTHTNAKKHAGIHSDTHTETALSSVTVLSTYQYVRVITALHYDHEMEYLGLALAEGVPLTQIHDTGQRTHSPCTPSFSTILTIITITIIFAIIILGTIVIIVTAVTINIIIMIIITLVIVVINIIHTLPDACRMFLFLHRMFRSLESPVHISLEVLRAS